MTNQKKNISQSLHSTINDAIDYLKLNLTESRTNGAKMSLDGR